MNGAADSFLDHYRVVRKNNILYGPTLDAKIDRRGLGSFAFSAFQEHAEKIFQVQCDPYREETYSDVREKSVRIAIEMRSMGIREGDIITICSGNTIDGILPVFAALYLNAVVSSIESTMPLRDVTYLIDVMRPKLIFVELAHLKLIEDALYELSLKTQIVVFGQHRNYTSFGKFLKPQLDESKFRPDNTKNDKSTAIMYFSSGTTGMPKPICLSSFGLLSSTTSLLNMGINADVVAQTTTLYWLSSMVNILLAMMNGGMLIVIDHYPDLGHLFKIAQDYKITFMTIPGTCSYQITRENTAPYDLSSLDTFVLIGYPIGHDHVEKVRKYFPNTCVTMGYGMTEAAGYISIYTKRTRKSNYRSQVSSSGRQLFNMNVKIVDVDTEETLGPNQEGEIRISTDSLMNGYYNMDSSEVFDSDGWFRTGDLGYYDDDYCLYVLDRIKDLLRYEPWQIVPVSVESVINTHPAVQESLIVGIPKFELGDVITALVVLKKDRSSTTPEEIERFANDNLSEGEQLRGGLKIVAGLPKTITGKVRRKFARDLYMSGDI